MHESGFVESNHSTGSADEPCVTVCIEPVDCPLDSDSSLSLATLQSQLPAATGLWYRLGSGRRAVRFDGASRKLLAPTGGWADKQLFAALSLSHHGSSCFSGAAFDKYDSATKSFQQTVAAVCGLLGDASLDDNAPEIYEQPIVAAKIKPEYEAYLTQSNAQPLQKASEEQIAQLQKQLNDKDIAVELASLRANEFEKEKEQLAAKVDQTEDQLRSVAAALEQKSSDNQSQAAAHEAALELLRKECEAKLTAAAESRDTAYDESLENAHTQIRGQEEEIRRLRSQIDQISLERDEIRQAENERAIIVEQQQQQQQSVPSENDECASLKSRNDELQAAVNQLKTEREEMWRTMSEGEHESKERERQLRDQLNEALQGFHDTKWRNGELEAALRDKQNEVEATYGRATELEGRLIEVAKACDDAILRSGELEKSLAEKEAALGEASARSAELQHQLLNCDQRAVVEMERQQQATSVNARRPSEPSDDMEDLSSELQKVHRRKYEMEQQLKQLSANQREEQRQLSEANAELGKLRDEIWIANEKRAELERHCGGVDGERNHLQHLLNESEQKIGWLEGELNETHAQIGRLQQTTNELQEFKARASSYLDDAFVVRKEPLQDRQKWTLSMWSTGDGGVGADGHFVRTWFEVSAPVDARNVYLLGSFVNWECALLCTLHEHGKWGVWADLPRGRYEFRFVVDGQWWCGDQFPRCHNDYGTENNWRIVE